MALIELKSFDDIYNAVLEETQIQSADTTSLNRVKRDINMVYQDFISRARWKWLTRTLDYYRAAEYTTGTVSVTAGSRSVTLSTSLSDVRDGYLFSVDGDLEVYRIQSHSGTAVVLESAYAGSTSTAASFSIWTDRVPLPVDCSETIEVGHFHRSTPLEGVGLQEMRRLELQHPKNANWPHYYTTERTKDGAPFDSIGSLPASVSRSSAGLVKTVVFASNVSSLLATGDRIQVTGASDDAYLTDSGRVLSVSTTTVTYITTTNLTEGSTADTGIVMKTIAPLTEESSFRELVLYPSKFDQDYTLRIDYIIDPPGLNNDGDEPVIPMKERPVLVYGALAKTWRRIGDLEKAAFNKSLYEEKISKLVMQYSDSTDTGRLVISKPYLSRKRNTMRLPRRFHSD